MPDSDFDRSDGTNGMLTFTKSGSGVFNSVRIRVRQIDYSWEVVSTESHARVNRAFYPHQRAVSRFSITPEFKGYGEFKAFSAFMWNYVKTFMGAERKSMLVNVPVRGFSRYGIPVSGIYDGDHVGSMVFAPTIVFEAMSDPLDMLVLTNWADGVASWDLTGTEGDQAKFFYPFSEGSHNANTKPETLYDYGEAPTLGAGISGALNGAIDNIVGTVGNAADAAVRADDDQRRIGN